MDLLIFDLDGTLIDSKLDLAHAVNATRSHMGLPALEHERVQNLTKWLLTAALKGGPGFIHQERPIDTARPPWNLFTVRH